MKHDFAGSRLELHSVPAFFLGTTSEVQEDGSMALVPDFAGPSASEEE